MPAKKAAKKPDEDIDVGESVEVDIIPMPKISVIKPENSSDPEKNKPPAKYYAMNKLITMLRIRANPSTLDVGSLAVVSINALRNAGFDPTEITQSEATDAVVALSPYAHLAIQIFEKTVFADYFAFGPDNDKSNKLIAILESHFKPSEYSIQTVFRA